jgi:hypothetical protein
MLALMAFACSRSSSGGVPMDASPGGLDGDLEGGGVEGGGDDGGAPDSSDGAAQGQPITAPDRVWTWVPFPNAFCADGAPTGIGVNLASGSTRVLILPRGGRRLLITWGSRT